MAHWLDDDTEALSEEESAALEGAGEAPAAPAEAEVPVQPQPDPGLAEYEQQVDQELQGQQQGQGQGHSVPLAALLAERKRAEAAHAELLQMRETQARVDERLRMLAERRAAEAAAQEQANIPPPPDPELEPAEHLRWQQEQLRAQQEQIWASQQQMARQSEEQAQMLWQNQVENWKLQQLPALNQAARQKYEDYEQVLQIALEAKAAELLPQVRDENELRGRMEETVKGVVQQCIAYDEAGRPYFHTNPSEAVYAYGKAIQQRLGHWFGQQGAGAPAAAPQAPAARPMAPPAAQPNGRLASIQHGVSNARSLGTARGGAAPTGALTMEALANMSEDDFARLAGDQIDAILSVQGLPARQ